MANEYATLAQLKDVASISDDVDDAALADALEGASRAVDAWCKRRFYTATETRYFSTRNPAQCLVWDLLSVTTLKTDDDGDRVYNTTWDSTDYALGPYNASLDGEPYLWIEVTPRTTKYFPVHPRGVEVVGLFGYSTTTPAAVEYATLLWAARLWERRHTILGISGQTGTGQVIVTKVPPDSDIKELLKAFRRGAALI